MFNVGDEVQVIEVENPSENSGSPNGEYFSVGDRGIIMLLNFEGNRVKNYLIHFLPEHHHATYPGNHEWFAEPTELAPLA